MKGFLCYNVLKWSELQLGRLRLWERDGRILSECLPCELPAVRASRNLRAKAPAIWPEQPSPQ